MKDRLTRERSAGFTLVELLIVILIIAILATLVTVSVAKARKSAFRAACQQDVTSMSSALKSFASSFGRLPGAEIREMDEESNLFPSVYRAIAEKHFEFKLANVVVEDGEDEEGNTVYRQADREERRDKDLDKYYVDPWNGVFRYRENKSRREKELWMFHPHSFDLWSIGPDGIDQSAIGDEEDNDDIGNW